MTRLLDIVKSYWVGLTLANLAAITYLSLWPLPQLPPVPGTDKTHHLIAYAVLMFPAALRKPKNWLLIGLLFIAYSAGIELIQPYVNRYGEWLDMLANSAGVVFGAIAAGLVNLFSSSRQKFFR
jgi:VanZ family protein